MHAFGVCGACVEELVPTGFGEDDVDDVLPAALELELVVSGCSGELLLVKSRTTVEELVRGDCVDVLSGSGWTAGVGVEEELLDCTTASACDLHMRSSQGHLHGNG